MTGPATDARATPASPGAVGMLEASPAALAAWLSCVLLLLSPVGDWRIRPLVLALAVLGLLWREGWRSPALWWALALLTGARVLLDWPLADNHAYLLVYWCLALALGVREPALLARNARLLIGLCFALAAWQKWSSADYRNDVFFLTTFLLDERFENLAVLSGLSYEQIDLAREYLEADPRLPSRAFPFELPLGLWLMARFSTVWNLAEQSLVALSFLVPPGSRLRRLRDPILLVFCLCTYAIAPVVGFGWILLAMGVAQAEVSHRLRRAYLATFVVLIFYGEVPWSGLLVDLFNLG